MTMRDPTLEEMVIALSTGGYTDPEDDNSLDIAEAIYWFANDWHGGQNSNLYSVLSTSPFRPSPLASGPESPADELYDALVLEFT